MMAISVWEYGVKFEICQKEGKELVTPEIVAYILRVDLMPALLRDFARLIRPNLEIYTNRS